MFQFLKEEKGDIWVRDPCSIPSEGVEKYRPLCIMMTRTRVWDSNQEGHVGFCQVPTTWPMNNSPEGWYGFNGFHPFHYVNGLVRSGGRFRCRCEGVLLAGLLAGAWCNLTVECILHLFFLFDFMHFFKKFLIIGVRFHPWHIVRP